MYDAFFFGSKVNFIYVTQYHSMSDAGYWKDMYQTFQTGGATCSSYYAKKKFSRYTFLVVSQGSGWEKWHLK
mgnify:CR=1 FL=1